MTLELASSMKPLDWSGSLASQHQSVLQAPPQISRSSPQFLEQISVSLSWMASIKHFKPKFRIRNAQFAPDSTADTFQSSLMGLRVQKTLQINGRPAPVGLVSFPSVNPRDHLQHLLSPPLGGKNQPPVSCTTSGSCFNC